MLRTLALGTLPWAPELGSVSTGYELPDSGGYTLPDSLPSALLQQLRALVIEFSTTQQQLANLIAAAAATIVVKQDHHQHHADSLGQLSSTAVRTRGQ